MHSRHGVAGQVEVLIKGVPAASSSPDGCELGVSGARPALGDDLRINDPIGPDGTQIRRQFSFFDHLLFVCRPGINRCRRDVPRINVGEHVSQRPNPKALVVLSQRLEQGVKDPLHENSSTDELLENAQDHRRFVAIALEINEDPNLADRLQFNVEIQIVSPLDLDVIPDSQSVDQIAQMNQVILNWQKRGSRSNNFKERAR